ncbi:hypothetical protein B2J88_01775 [Rhodococcus sp. SRB_17]|nr:hypothetical protein [Rhodococcus sp. SRB_17]
MNFKPTRPMLPDNQFCFWATKSICKGLYVSIPFGILCAVVSLIDRPVALVPSALVLHSMIYLLTVVASMVGLVQGPWSEVKDVLVHGKSSLVRGLISALILSIGTLLVYKSAAWRFGIDNGNLYLGARTLALFTCTAIAMTATLRVFQQCVSGHREDAHERRSAWQRTRKLISPVRRIRQLTVIIPAFAVVIASLVVAMTLSQDSSPWLTWPFYCATTGVAAVLIGTTRRLFDLVKPYGEQGKLLWA